MASDAPELGRLRFLQFGATSTLVEPEAQCRVSRTQSLYRLKSPLKDRHSREVTLWSWATSYPPSASPGAALTAYLWLSLYPLFLPDLGSEAESYLPFQWGSLRWALRSLETWILKDKEPWGLKLRRPNFTPGHYTRSSLCQHKIPLDSPNQVS